MTSPHNSVSILSRSSGARAVASAAYRHATQMQDGRGGPTQDYSGKRRELKHAEVMLPADAAGWARAAFGPAAFEAALRAVRAEAAAEGRQLTEGQAERAAWARVSERLWTSVEDGEDRLNRRKRQAQLARMVIVALPRVLSRAGQIDLMRGYIEEAFTSQGMIADWVLHDTGNGNPHAHIMLTMREIGETDWALKNREWNRTTRLRSWRRAWADYANLVLEREGFAERIDHRSLKAQGLELAPENYDPHVAAHAARIGEEAREKRRCAEVRARNQAWLRAHPEHILVVVQARQAVFSKTDLRRAFAKRLDLDVEAHGAALDALVAQAMASPDLLPVVGSDAGRGDREPLYMTTGKARQAQQVARDAGRLARLRLEVRGETGADPFEAGTGPILIDVAGFGAAEGAVAPPAPPSLASSRPAPTGPSAEAVRAALEARAEDLFRAAFGEPVRPGAAEWRARESEALAMQMRGPKRGLWRDHSAGEGGDLLDLVAREFCGLGHARSDFPGVLAAAADWLGLSAGESRPEAAGLARLEARRAARETEAAREAARETARRAALVRDVAARAAPVAHTAGGPVTATEVPAVIGTPASAYLAKRGITVLPDEGLAWLPGVREGAGPRGLPGAGHDALVVWATNAAGTITGGQRILIGAGPSVDLRKPSFGTIGGSVARFPAVQAGADAASRPLVIAEGPETALAIRQETGLESWAVFGVSGFASAPIPTDREVILAPDRDAPDSPAGRGFRKAVAHHLGRGCDLRVAPAPEPVGSKRDLNDTLRDQGGAAVRAAIAGARVVRPLLSADLNPGQRAAALAMLSAERLTLVTGHAGTGKTFTIGQAALAWQAQGVEVLAGAPSGKATQALAALPGVQAATLSAWEARWARGEAPERGKFVFFMDEAAMVGAGQWARVQSRVGAMGGKLIAVGDPEQLQPVMDLSAWALAEADLRARGGTVPVIDLVMRQRDAGDARATGLLAVGDARSLRAGLAHYVKSGALRLDEETLAAPVAALAAAYFERGGPGPERIAMGYTNRDVLDLNAAIRAEAVARGVVADAGGREIGIERIARSAGTGDPSARRVEAKIRIAAGDRVMLTRPLPEHGLPRSGFGTVTDMTDSGVRVLMDGATAAVGIEAAALPFIDYGYAATIHKTQGMTVEESFVLPHRSMDRYALNVALTRHRGRVTIFGREGHCADGAAFRKLGQRRARPVGVPERAADVPMVPVPEGVAARADWTGAARAEPTGSLLADRHLMAVAARVAGLLSADHADTDALVSPEGEDPEDYLGHPQRVVDDLVSRTGVVLADEVAGALSRQVQDPDSFLRLFEEAMRHPDLVALPRAEGRAGDGDPRVYTTQTLLEAELTALDRGLRMAVAHEAAVRAVGPDAASDTAPDTAPGAAGDGDPVPEAVPTPDRAPDALLTADIVAGLDPDQRAAFEALRARPERGLDIVQGGTGSGKTRLAAALARAETAAGRVVCVVSPTEAGRGALREEGVAALTLAEYFADPVQRKRQGDPARVVIVDDAHGLGIAPGSGGSRADVLLARIEAEGSRLIALVNPARRPTAAGPVLQRLAERLEQDDPTRAVRLTGLHGPDPSATGESLRALATGLRGSGAADVAAESLRCARASGLIEAGGGREAALARVARNYVADRRSDRLALGWARADADALTTAIRARLDAVDPARRAFQAEAHGPLKGLKPGDRIRFATGGQPGVRTYDAGVIGSGTVGSPRPQVARGEMAEVLGRDGVGALRLRVTGAAGTREMAVPAEGPLPAWHFAFASTLMASAGRRHESAHVLASPGMDREMFAVGAHVARSALRVVLAVEGSRLDGALEKIAARVRMPRSGLDYGFDPARTMAAARAAEGPAGRDGDIAVAPDPGPDREALAALARVPRVSRSAAQVRAQNVAWLTENPEQVLAIVQSNRGVFSEGDVRQALRVRLGGGMGEAALREFGDRVMGSGDLVRLARPGPDGAPQYTTTARAGLLGQLRTDAAALAGARFAPGAEEPGTEAASARPRWWRGDGLDRLNPGQLLAAEAMLDPARLTLVTGHAGTGKTRTLAAVAAQWQARGVPVLAGAASGKATDELAAELAGVETATLAGWEARWARGEGLPGAAPMVGDTVGDTVTDRSDEGAGRGFVFLMDEAGMVGAGQWARVQARVLAMGGKLIAVGDPEQLQPVSDLPGFAIAERAAGGSAVIDIVVRQQSAGDAQATGDLARGGPGIARALQHYAGRGALRLDPEVRADPVGALARDFVAGLTPGEETGTQIALAYSNRDVADLNDAIHARALAGGVIGARSVRQYGEITRVFARAGGSQDHGGEDRVRVPLSLGEGARITLTRAHVASGRPRSSFGTVVATRESGIDVRFDGAEEICALDLSEFRDLDYGYAATVHRSQGLSADRVHVLPHRRMHRHAVYVALSRHREAVSVYGRVGHMECLADLTRLGQAGGHLDMDAAEIDRLAGKGPAAGMVPGAEIAGPAGRADWQAMTGSTLVPAGGGLAGDAALMGVAERVAGLMAAEYRPGQALLRAEAPERARRVVQEPQSVIDDLLRRNSVFRADDVAGQLSAVIAEPETFLRLFGQAMRHPDLVVLAETDGSGRGPVYSTGTRIRRETGAVDRGARLALALEQPGAPTVMLDDLQTRDPALRDRLASLPDEQRDVLWHVMAPGRLRLVRGEAGSGKTRVAAETAGLHAAAGWQVLVVAPTGAGLSALESAGVDRPRTLHRFMADTVPSGPGADETRGRVQLDPATVVVLDDAGRLGGEEVAALLERVEESGARLVAFMGGEEQAPMGAGAVMRALEMRVGSGWLGDDRTRGPWSATVLSGLVKGGDRAVAEIERLAQDHALTPGGDARRAIEVLARAYVSDPVADKVALAWSRADAGALNTAIRAELDAVDPERRGFRAEAHGPLKGLKPGDRIRFLASSPWRPPAERDATWATRRLRAGEQAEVLGRDAQSGGLVLRVAGQGNAKPREIVLPRGAEGEVPKWGFAFAGTIHGEGARVRESVHLLVASGMTRQVLAAGVAAHARDLKMVMPSAEARMKDLLTRIVRREGRAETVLDYGFDPAQGARAAVLGRSVEIAPEAGGVSGAVERLAALAGLSRDPGRDPLPGGVESEVLAEVIGAAILRDGAAPGGKDRLAVERYVGSLGDRKAWRALLRHLPASLPGAADQMARREVGVDNRGRPLAVARYLARGGLAARTLGEEEVARLFEAGLTLYGTRVEMARTHGRMDALVPKGVADAPTPDWPDPEDRPGKAGPRRSGGSHARGAGRGRKRGLLEEALAGTHASDEQMARMALEIFGITDRPRRRARRLAYKSALRRGYEAGVSGTDTRNRAAHPKESRTETVVDAVSDQRATPGRADPAAPRLETGAETEGPPAPDYPPVDWDAVMAQTSARNLALEREMHAARADTALALRLAVAISARAAFEDPIHQRDLPKEIAGMFAADPEGAGTEDILPRLERVVNRKGCAPAHRTLADAALGALQGGPLPEQEALLAGRGEVLEALAAPDRPAGLPQALITRMAEVFTQSEIRALTDASEALPESVPALGAQTRAWISDGLMDAARARDPGLRPDAPEGAAMETEQETRMKEPQETRDKTTIRGETMSSVLLNDVSAETFSDLRKGFSFEEIRALRDPERALPAGLPDLTADERRQIAAVLTAGPPKPERSGTGGGPAAFVPDPKYDGWALQLACAITERVAATDPIHQRDLVSDIRALLKAADGAQDLPEIRVRQITAGPVTNALGGAGSTRRRQARAWHAAMKVAKGDPHRGPEAQAADTWRELHRFRCVIN